MSPKLLVLSAVIVLTLCSCHSVDRGFKAANYGTYGQAVSTECWFQNQENLDVCRKVFSCVNLWMVDHDTSGNPYKISERFAAALPEFVHTAYRWQDKPDAQRPDGEIDSGEYHLEYRIYPDGEIWRWSSQADDWKSTGRNISNESLPTRVNTLINTAMIKGDMAAVHMFQLFLKSRQACYTDYK